MERIAPLADEFFTNVLYDEEPIFVSDEATIWDISCGPSEQELLQRCSTFYKAPVTAQDLAMPLWMLIEKLNHSRDSEISK
jgi:hypothetical protein